MTITYDIYSSINNEFIGTRCYEVSQISQWRNGFCICMCKENNATAYFLVNSQHKAIVKKSTRESGCCWQGYFGSCIKRVFGGAYVVYEAKCNALTFPGKDRDTEYSYYKVPVSIITENGHILSYEEFVKYIKRHKILECRELFDGIVLCNNATYNLSDYSLINTLPDSVSVNYTAENDGTYKAYILSDHCRLYVLVKSKKIIRYFHESDFLDIADILKAQIPKLDNRSKARVYPPKDVEVLPSPLPYRYREVIKGYYYTLLPKYGCAFVSNFPSIFSHADMLESCISYSGYYQEKGVWYKLNISDLQLTIDEMLKEHHPVRNFITEIRFISNVLFKNQNVSMYSFECKPYGTIDSNGVFQYCFDPYRIIW